MMCITGDVARLQLRAEWQDDALEDVACRGGDRNRQPFWSLKRSDCIGANSMTDASGLMAVCA
eukprot:5637175-Amphidinium_carterae.1